MTTTEYEYEIGDRVTYYYPGETDHGISGQVVGTAMVLNGIRYKIEWDSGDDEETAEAGKRLRPIDFDDALGFSKKTAESIATYLALDSVEDPIVARWIQELQDYASRK